MSFFKNFEDNLGKATMSAVANAGLIMLLAPASGETQIRGIRLKYLFPAVVFVGSMISDMTHDVILKNIPQSKKYATVESAVLNLGVASGASALLMKFADQGGDLSNLGRVAMIGGASDIIGHWTWHNILQPVIL